MSTPACDLQPGVAAQPKIGAQRRLQGVKVSADPRNSAFYKFRENVRLNQLLGGQNCMSRTRENVRRSHKFSGVSLPGLCSMAGQCNT